MIKFGRILLALAAAAGALPAVPVTWYLRGVTFTDGGSAVGSFVFDASTGGFSAINVMTTPGSSATASSSRTAGGNYTVLRPEQATAGRMGFLTDATVTRGVTRSFAISLAAALTDAGGAIPLAGDSSEGVCAVAPCVAVFGAASVRFIASGAVVAQPANGPKTWYLTATLDDGGQAFGTFTFDAASGSYSAIDIAATTGSTFAEPARFRGALAATSGNSRLRAVAALPAQAGTRLLVTSFSLPLSNAGGTIAIVPADPAASGEAVCSSVNCTTVSTERLRLVVAGSVTTIRPQGYTKILSHFADGGPWRSLVQITNLTDAPSVFTATVFKGDGSVFSLPGVGSNLSAVVPGRGVTFLSSSGTGGGTETGWIRVDGANNFSVNEIFVQRNANSGGDSQGSVSGDASGTVALTMPFDNTGGAIGGFALANPDPAQPVTVLAVAYDEAGNILMRDSSVTLPANGQTAFAASAGRYPEIVGKRGLIRFFGLYSGAPPYAGLNGLLLKFLPNGSFTTVAVANQ